MIIIMVVIMIMLMIKITIIINFIEFKLTISTSKVF